MTAAADLACRRETRRQLVRDHEKLNGIDYLDVGVTAEGVFLCVHFFNGLPGRQELSAANVVIRGGRRVRGIRALDLDFNKAKDEFDESCLGIELSAEGDFSTYTLCFVELDELGRPTDQPLRSLDPRYACIDFRFKVDCPAPLDCRTGDPCSGAGSSPPAGPDINYLAKDYASFRQLLLDRLAVVMPEWRERHVPDAGIALVELLAYVADHLSYTQDAVATEAYLDTARLRTSVRRHVRLVDYRMHEGCNARTFVALNVRSDAELEPRDLYFATAWNLAPGSVLDHTEFEKGLPGVTVFEPLLEEGAVIRVRAAHNAISLYTWGNTECCLPEGATRATLCDGYVEEPRPPEPPPYYAPEKPPKKGKQAKKYVPEPEPEPPPPKRRLSLQPGDFLLFEELACAATAAPDRKEGCTPARTSASPDADPAHRHVVRLTRVTPLIDPLDEQPVVDVEWSIEDALPFPLCISAIGRPPECELVHDLTIARGNVLLADHGLTIAEALPPVRQETSPDVCEDVESLAYVTRTAERYRPALAAAPLTYAEPLPANAPAQSLLTQDPRSARPAVWLDGIAASYARPFPSFDPAALTETDAIARRLRNSLSADLLEMARRLSASLRVRLLEHDYAARIPRELHDALAGEMPEKEGLDPAAMHNLAMALADAADPSLTTLRYRLAGELRDRFAPGQPELTADERNQLVRNLRGLLERWTVRADLLASEGDDADFVVELDDRGTAELRFGDGELGRAVEPGMAFLATYRTGSGRAGLIGRETLRHVVFRRSPTDAIVSVRNPLAATGAVEPEPVSDVRMLAPSAFRGDLQRAVIADDYAQVARLLGFLQPHPRIQSTAARLQWNGSWFEAGVAVDRIAAAERDTELIAGVTRRLERVRRMGHDVRAGDARTVPLYLKLRFCIRQDFLAGHVLAAVTEVVRAFFHPDRVTFGESVYVSRIVAAVQAVEGVLDVDVVDLRRLFAKSNPDLADGFLRLGGLEVARLDHDPARPENGWIEFEPRGGR
jgi:hypothetical protein